MYKNVRILWDWAQPLAKRALVRLGSMPLAMKLHLAWVLLVVVGLIVVWPRPMLFFFVGTLASAVVASVYYSVYRLICYFRESDHE